ncbi:MAG: hypothetical protein Q7U64_15125 [Desulfocapsaceae bacterium]|nr:hypothetical protein [Desulfocapsaceae bacterium]
MKKITFTMLFCLLIVSVAHADWIETFSSLFKSKGIEPAVTQALKEGQSPSAIIHEGLKLDGLNPQNLLKALYCAGVKGDDIKAASDEEGISVILLVAAYEKSVAECGDQLADTQAYTPVGPSFSGIPSPGSGGNSYGSPATF